MDVIVDSAVPKCMGSFKKQRWGSWIRQSGMVTPTDGVWWMLSREQLYGGLERLPKIEVVRISQVPMVGS